MKKAMLFAAISALFLATNANAARYIVSYDANRADQVRSAIANAGGEITRQFEIINAVVAELPDVRGVEKISKAKGVQAVEEDKVINWLADEASTLRASNELPSLSEILSRIQNSNEEGITVPVPASISEDNTVRRSEFPWGITRVNAKGAWNFTEGAGVKVAVVDTGINYNHADLKANYVDGANYAGLIKGLLGINWGDPMDDQGHGTHVAGTIAAVRDGKGVVGVAPKAKLYAVKVMTKAGRGSLSAIIKGLEWAVKNKMNIANMSLGGGPYVEAMHKAVKNAVENGVTIIAAAGNDSGPVNYPAKYPETIAVSASAPNDKIAPFSSRGAEIDVMAPGMWIMSTSFDGGYVEQHGTSMACPHVAGLAALAYAAGYRTSEEIRAALKKAAVPVKDLTPEEQGAGIPDAAKLKK